MYVFWILGALLMLVAQRRSATAAAPSVDDNRADDRDFAIYQNRLSSQTRRLESLDVALIGLAALFVAAWTVVGTLDHSESLGYRVFTSMLLLLAAIVITAFVAHRSYESPDLEDFREIVERYGRTRALEMSIDAMTRDYRRNERTATTLLLVIRLTTTLGGLITLGALAWRMLK